MHATSIVLLLAAITAAGAARVQAQPLLPAEAVATAVGLLERDGYRAGFVLDGTTLRGVAAYQTPASQGLLIEDAAGADVEYLLQDPVLFVRRRTTGDAWEEWQQTVWHPDLPVPGAAAYPPRLLLELLRVATDLRDTGLSPDGGRRLEGSVSYTTALFASYEDVPATAQQRAAAAVVRWPVSIDLDRTDGALRRLTLVTPADAEGNPASSVLTFTAGPIPPDALRPPLDVAMQPSAPTIRAAPTEDARPLPIEASGQGDAIRTPVVRSLSSSIILRLTPSRTDTTVYLWRIKRGRLLLAAAGTAIVGSDGDVLTFLFDVAPGDYLVEATLPVGDAWTLTLVDGAAQEQPLLPSSTMPATRVDYPETRSGGAG